MKNYNTKKSWIHQLSFFESINMHTMLEFFTKTKKKRFDFLAGFHWVQDFDSTSENLKSFNMVVKMRNIYTADYNLLFTVLAFFDTEKMQFQSLPVDILFYICKFLPIKAILNLAETNKYFRFRIQFQEQLWKLLCERGFDAGKANLQISQKESE